MKCQVCREPAVIDVRRHNANFCQDHFIRHCRQQVQRVIDDFGMLATGERALVAVSGGKDSLAVWDILLELGYQADGFYVGLGIGDYSEVSGDHAARYAEQRGVPLRRIDLRADYGYDVPTASVASGRVPCSACGLSKRHIFDAVTLEGGYDALVTGNNLDDEAAVLYGNVMRWQTDYLGRQRPVLAAGDGFPRKIKPLVRLTERETAAYCVLRGIDYLVEECPMVAGNKHLGYKDALNRMEAESPGSKTEFYFGYLKRAADRFHDGDGARQVLGRCDRCGSPTEAETCSFCRLAAQASVAEPVPVDLVLNPKARRRKPRAGAGRSPNREIRLDRTRRPAGSHRSDRTGNR